MPRFLPRDDAVSDENHAVISSLLKLAKHPGITAENCTTLERKSLQTPTAVPYRSLSLLKLNKHQSITANIRAKLSRKLSQPSTTIHYRSLSLLKLDKHHVNYRALDGQIRISSDYATRRNKKIIRFRMSPLFFRYLSPP